MDNLFGFICLLYFYVAVVGVSLIVLWVLGCFLGPTLRDRIEDRMWR